MKGLDFTLMLKMKGYSQASRCAFAHYIWHKEVVALLERFAVGSILLEIGRSLKQGVSQAFRLPNTSYLPIYA
jgi:hypothetical protein